MTEENHWGRGSQGLMGKITGFLEIERTIANTRRSPSALKHYKEFVVP
jgi:hypothetical protein